MGVVNDASSDDWEYNVVLRFVPDENVEFSINVPDYREVTERALDITLRYCIKPLIGHLLTHVIQIIGCLHAYSCACFAIAARRECDSTPVRRRSWHLREPFIDFPLCRRDWTSKLPTWRQWPIHQLRCTGVGSRRVHSQRQHEPGTHYVQIAPTLSSGSLRVVDFSNFRRTIRWPTAHLVRLRFQRRHSRRVCQRRFDTLLSLCHRIGAIVGEYDCHNATCRRRRQRKNLCPARVHCCSSIRLWLHIQLDFAWLFYAFKWQLGISHRCWKYRAIKRCRPRLFKYDDRANTGQKSLCRRYIPKCSTPPQMARCRFIQLDSIKFFY